MNFQGPLIRLSDEDLPRIGYGIGVGEDEIHAFLEVETSGSGFDKKGRPKLLREPHVFYRLLGPGPKRDLAVKKGLAYPNWGTRPYPPDSYPDLAAMMEIDPLIALQSCSWGVGQMMGFNAQACGYATATEMVTAFVEKGEPEQLQAAVNFIKHEHLDDELRARNWAGFARGYNGAGYAKNMYDKKLAAAFLKWSNIKDTAWTPGQSMRVAMNTITIIPPELLTTAPLATPAVPTPITASPPPAPIKPTLPMTEPPPPPGMVRTGGLWAGLKALLGGSTRT